MFKKWKWDKKKKKKWNKTVRIKFRNGNHLKAMFRLTLDNENNKHSKNQDKEETKENVYYHSWKYELRKY